MSPRTVLGIGPGFKGVNDTIDPADDTAQGQLRDAQNCYIANQDGVTGLSARPGIRNGTATVAATTQAGEMYTFVALDGTVLRFAITNGKLFRFTATAGNPLTVATDVTPVGCTISNSSTPTSRFYITQLADQIIVSDGVNRPWAGSNLSSTPITGTNIELTTAGGAWSAQGAPVVYQGSLFFIAKTVPGGTNVTAGLGIVWCEPNQPSVGYVQTGYANYWNLIEQSSQPIFALAPQNNTLYYFRENSIGAVSGTPGGNFSSTASRDLVSVSVGCTSPKSIVQFGDTIFFVDRIGRPYSFTPGSTPVALWKQLRGQIDNNPTFVSYPASTAYVGVGCVASQMNLVLLGGWSASPTSTPASGPLILYVFDATTGQYYGRWSIDTAMVSVGFVSVTEMADSNNTPLVTIMGGTGGSTYKFFTMQALGADIWTDGTTGGTLYTPTITATTNPLGYSADTVYNATDVGTIVTQSTALLTVTVQTPYTSSTTEATEQATNLSQNSTYRTTFGMDVAQARSIQVKVQRNGGDTRITESSSVRVTESDEVRITESASFAAQWVLQSINFPAVPSQATVYDQ